ncbi:Hypothetical protein FKW44_015058 [Caligus rogercresseyi]|uniref:Uncharacterized protein n=1 Tax=Caligus rogercresseyi TaxID=217165 RepID=A0A7T8GZS1_CALRO|nr:Hypothetical protein FKW44_015058 [Caligus rogercresseyi]
MTASQILIAQTCKGNAEFPTIAIKENDKYGTFDFLHEKKLVEISPNMWVP